MANATDRQSSSDDLFPRSPRVIYAKAPLAQVICQLRFPSILRIESQAPAEFQERIRSIFPLLEKGNPLLGQFPQIAQLPPEFMQLIGPVPYEFLTEDRNSTVTLAPDSIALTATKYLRWEDYREQLRAPLVALAEVYRPAFFSRIGLRYVDAIERGVLGLSERPWSQLLRPEVLGELALPEFEAHLETLNRSIRVKIPDGSGSVLLRHGLATVQGHSEISYMIDFDFFSERKTEVADAEKLLNHFNELAGRAFRWCITDTLRDALGPRPLEDNRPRAPGSADSAD